MKIWIKEENQPGWREPFDFWLNMDAVPRMNEHILVSRFILDTEEDVTFTVIQVSHVFARLAGHEANKVVLQVIKE